MKQLNLIIKKPKMIHQIILKILKLIKKSQKLQEEPLKFLRRFDNTESALTSIKNGEIEKFFLNKKCSRKNKTTGYIYCYSCKKFDNSMYFQFHNNSIITSIFIEDKEHVHKKAPIIQSCH